MWRQDALVILQARMGSRRLPGKVLAPLAGRPVVVHCIERLLVSQVGPVIVATSERPEDDRLARVAEDAGSTVVRGSSDDVLERFVDVLEAHPASVVIRATADNPAVDPLAPSRLARWLDTGQADYVVDEGLPVGATVEAVRTGALLEAHRRACDPSDREHVTTWVVRRQDRFRVLRIPATGAVRRPDLRFTVDTPADLHYMHLVFSHAGERGGLVPLERLIEAADQAGTAAKVA